MNENKRPEVPGPADSVVGSFPIVQIDPLEEPQFLGGDFKPSKINSDSVYGRLSRPAPANLHGLHSSDTNFWDKTSEAIFHKIFSGDLTFVTMTSPKSTSISYQVGVLVRLDGDTEMHEPSSASTIFGEPWMDFRIESLHGRPPERTAHRWTTNAEAFTKSLR